jgi:hypothetical protein
VGKPGGSPTQTGRRGQRGGNLVSPTGARLPLPAAPTGKARRRARVGSLGRATLTDGPYVLRLRPCPVFRLLRSSALSGARRPAGCGRGANQAVWMPLRRRALSRRSRAANGRIGRSGTGRALLEQVSQASLRAAAPICCSLGPPLSRARKASSTARGSRRWRFAASVSGSWNAPPQWGQGSERVDISRAASPPGNMRRSSTIVVEPLISRETGASGAVPRAWSPSTRCCAMSSPV